MNIKLSQWAKENSYTYLGAYYAYKRGDVKGAFQTESGTILVSVDSEVEYKIQNIVYARVSSSEQKSNLEMQSERVQNYSIAKGWQIDQIVTDIGSGLNDNRKGLSKILEINTPVRLIIEHKDRLTRFGFNYILAHIEQNGGEIHIINNVYDKEDDIVQDFVSIITSMCARIYGQRRSKRKTEQLINELKNEN